MTDNRKLQLDDLLSGLKSEGEVVSSDADFTLHHSKAKEKLKKFQLSNPFFYILKLVQSAVLSEATKIEVECSPHQVSLSHDGALPSSGELQELLNFVFQVDHEVGRHTRSLKRLASAVNTAVSAHARELSIECHGNEEAYSQTWSASGAEFRELTPGKFRGLRFLLKRKPGDVVSSIRHVGGTRIVDLVQGTRNSMQKEEAALRDRAVFCSTPIFLDGEQLNRTSFGAPRYPEYEGNKEKKVPFFCWVNNRDHYVGRAGHNRYHVIQAYIKAQEGQQSSLLAPERSNSFLVSEIHPHNAGEACSMMIGLELARKYPSRVNFIAEGVFIQQEQYAKIPRGLFALVSADHLRTDLSGFQLTKSDNYLTCMEAFADVASGLIQEARHRNSEIPFEAVSGRFARF